MTPKKRICLSVYDPPLRPKDGEKIAGKHIIRQAVSYGRVLFTESDCFIYVNAPDVLITNCVLEQL